jgi:hypothetical protein
MSKRRRICVEGCFNEAAPEQVDGVIKSTPMADIALKGLFELPGDIRNLIWDFAVVSERPLEAYFKVRTVPAEHRNENWRFLTAPGMPCPTVHLEPDAALVSRNLR